MSKPVYLGKGKWGKVEDQMPEDWDFAKNEWKSNKPKLIQWDEVDSYLKKGYIAEEKRDGARMALHITNEKLPDTVMFGHHNDYDQKRKFPELDLTITAIQKRMKLFNIKSITFDGELVSGDYTKQNRSDDFWALNGRLHLENPLKIKMSENLVTYVAFDILEMNGKTKQKENLEDKRELINDLTAEPSDWEFRWGIESVMRVDDDITFDYANDSGLEGFVLKHPKKNYFSTWYKVKAILDDTFDVVGVQQKEQNVVLKLRNSDGKDVGGVVYYGKLDSDRLIGKRVIVSYMRGNTDGLRFPVLNKVL
tara:strand:+ start:227 stop:1150 length:924 start_codon:yes stop_codon:yes gene_type:complete